MVLRGDDRPTHARPRSAAGRTVRALAALVGAGGVLTAVLLVVPGSGGAESDPTPCPGGVQRLDVVTAPELADALSTATADMAGGLLDIRPDADAGVCLHVTVTGRDPGDVAAALQAGSPLGADVWVPDSSLWVRQLTGSGHVPEGGGRSLAQSPVVFAVDRATAEHLGWPARQPSIQQVVGEQGRARLGLPDPHRSVPARAGLLGLQGAFGAGADGRVALAAVLRSAVRDVPADPAASVEEISPAVPLTVPVPEQVVWARQGGVGSPPVVAVYPAVGAALDYPYVVLTDDDATRAAAATLGNILAGPGWTAIVQDAGFRSADGSAGEALTSSPAVEPDLARTTSTPDPAALDAAVETFDVITRGTRLLAVLDVSGSMAREVPGSSGATRMELALEAAANGLALYPDDAVVGLWVFSTELNGAEDHRQLVPLGPLGARGNGVPGREQLAEALAGVRYVPDGDTGLYDTTLAAVRAVREGWDPGRVNSVVVLTDGRNEDTDGISLETLLTRLRAEAGDRPVPVITVAYGPDTDLDAMRAISRTTGGATYRVPDPRRVYEVLGDALARRPCRPSC